MPVLLLRAWPAHPGLARGKFSRSAFFSSLADRFHFTSAAAEATKIGRPTRKVVGRPAAPATTIVTFAPAGTTSLAPEKPSATPALVNLARSAIVTVSSEQPGINQGANNAIDGNPATEVSSVTLASTLSVLTCPFRRLQWSTYQQREGAWIKLSWPQPVTFNQLVLFDRKSLLENVLSGLVTFADGSTVITGPVLNNGAPTYFNFTSVSTTSLTFKVTLVSRPTANAGLADIQLYQAAPSSLKNLLDVKPAGSALWLPYIPANPKAGRRSLQIDDLETRSIKERLALVARNLSAPTKARHARDFVSIGDDFGADQIMVEESVDSRCSGLDRGCEVTADSLFEGKA